MHLLPQHLLSHRKMKKLLKCSLNCSSSKDKPSSCCCCIHSVELAGWKWSGLSWWQSLFHCCCWIFTSLPWGWYQEWINIWDGIGLCEIHIDLIEQWISTSISSCPVWPWQWQYTWSFKVSPPASGVPCQMSLVKDWSSSERLSSSACLSICAYMLAYTEFSPSWTNVYPYQLLLLLLRSLGYSWHGQLGFFLPLFLFSLDTYVLSLGNYFLRWLQTVKAILPALSIYGPEKDLEINKSICASSSSRYYHAFINFQ